MKSHKLKQAAVLVLVTVLAAGAGVWWARRDTATSTTSAEQGEMSAGNKSDAAKKPLYLDRPARLNCWP